jgi:hypothetical protein
MARDGMINVAQRVLEFVQKDAELAALITSGDRRVAKMGLTTFNRQNTIRSQLVAHTWRKIGRQVLAMHPGVVDEVKIAGGDKIPGEILRVLPYMNPLIIFDEPPVFRSWVRPGDTHRQTRSEEANMRLLGFFTFGSSIVATREGGPDSNTVPDIRDMNAAPFSKDSMIRYEQRIHSTTDADADRFGMLLIFEVLDKWGNIIDWECNTVTVFFSDTMTLAETVDAIMTRFHFDAEHMSERELKLARRWMRQVLSIAMGSLFYLCSTTLEAEKVPAKAVAKRMPKHLSRRPLSMYRVGWTYGAAVTRIRQDRSRAAPSEMGDERHQQDPQHRRSHFKMQWYGPRDQPRCNTVHGSCSCGGQHAQLIFVSAYWTHVERLGEQGVNVARKVTSLGKNEPRQSLETALTAGD